MHKFRKRNRRSLHGPEPLEGRQLLAVATLLVDINPGAATSNISQLTDVNGTAYFTAETPGRGREIWKTDGTAEGTVRVTDLPGVDANSVPSELTNVDGTLFFKFDHGIWKTDGTTAGTQSVVQLNLAGLTNVGGTLFFYGYRQTHENASTLALWKSDGSEAGTVRVSDLAHPYQYKYGYETPSPPEEMIDVSGELFLSLNNTYAGVGIVKSDGTAAGTVYVRSEISSHDLVNANGKLLFGGSDGEGNTGLWKSNGTPDSTVPFPSPRGFIQGLIDVGGQFYFESNGNLWRTDGFPSGTVQLTNTTTGFRHGLANVDGTLYFVASDDQNGGELWTSDGTAAGTHLVKDIAPGADGINGGDMAAFAGKAYFGADDGVHGRELWATDGTEAGTQMIGGIAGPGGASPFSISSIGGVLYFTGTDPAHGRELWRLEESPTLGGGGKATYTENAQPLLIWPSAAVSDPDSADFNHGQLKLSITKNAQADDRISIRNAGTGTGQIGVSGVSVTFGGTLIGKLSGGGAAPLTVALNANATLPAVRALVRALTFRTLGDTPSTLSRTLSLRVSDGDGGLSNMINKTINVHAVNDSPRLVLGGQMSYKNNSPAILLAPAATVSDPDSANFFGGSLTVDISSGGGPSNRLWVSGAYSLQGDRLLRYGAVVGTVIDGGFGWNPLRLRFNTQMTAVHVQELVRSLRFRTVDNTNLDPRIISFTLTDGDGGVSATQFKTINVS